jgi:hypothetical protein
VPLSFGPDCVPRSQSTCHRSFTLRTGCLRVFLHSVPAAYAGKAEATSQFPVVVSTRSVLENYQTAPHELVRREFVVNVTLSTLSPQVISPGSHCQTVDIPRFSGRQRQNELLRRRLWRSEVGRKSNSLPSSWQCSGGVGVEGGLGGGRVGGEEFVEEREGLLVLTTGRA